MRFGQPIRGLQITTYITGFFISTLSMEAYGALEVEQLDMGLVEGCDALRSRITWMQKVPELESLRAALASLREL